MALTILAAILTVVAFDTAAHRLAKKSSRNRSDPNGSFAPADDVELHPQGNAR